MYYFYLITLALLAAAATAPTTAHAKINKLALVSPGIYRGSQPETADDYRLLKTLGIRTILNLRNERNKITAERVLAANEGLEVRSLPMSAILPPGDTTVDRALDNLGDPNLRPIFVHCQHGKDRTGLIVGLFRVEAERWSAKKAYAQMRDFGFNPLLLGLDYYFWHRAHR